MMEKIQEIERAVKNFNVVWDKLTRAERREIAEDLATEIKKIKNEYAKQEIWRRIYTCKHITHYIAKFM